MLLSLKNTRYSRGSKLLFDDLDFTLNSRDRVGLVGHNGCGKTSLLSLLSGQAKPDEGERIARRGLSIGLMEQFVPPELLGVELRTAVLEVVPPAQRETEQWRVDALLSKLGLHGAQRQQTLSSLSGGQQNLALFARAQLNEPEVLLMDEPGNHMDVAALTHLRHYLEQTDNLSFVMISHDRELLDNCCERTVFMRDKRTYAFQMPYSQARQALAEHDLQAQNRHAVEQKEIDRIRASSKRIALWGKTYSNEKLSRKANSMALRADKLADEQTFVSQGSGLDLNLSGESLNSKTVFTLENLEVRTEDNEHKLLTCEHLLAKPGDRIALLGANGTGKSTTIRRLLGAHSVLDPQIRFNPQIQIGYFDQELNGMDSKKGRFDWLRDNVDAPEGTIKQTLIRAGIAFADFSQPIATLSGGEKARLRFMLLALLRANLMILDEPTNHIDLESREQLEQQLIDVHTTLLVTSHDRTFLNAVCNRFWVIKGQQLREVEYLQQYYTEMETELFSTVDSAAAAATATTQVAAQDALMERIGELEELIAADKARKPKFQKVERQEAWQKELDRLWGEILAQEE